MIEQTASVGVALGTVLHAVHVLNFVTMPCQVTGSRHARSGKPSLTGRNPSSNCHQGYLINLSRVMEIRT